MSGSEKSGWMRKQGGRFKAYKKRFFQLRDGALYYYKTDKDFSKPNGVVNLTGCRVAVEADQKKHKNGFTIAGPFPRVYHISAETPEEMTEWMEAINNVIYRLESSGSSASGSSASGSGASGSGASGSGSSSSAAAPAEEETLINPTSKKVSLKDFDLLKVIGRGSFGKVMMVRYKETGTIYAMKSLRKDLVIRENMVAHTKSEKEILQSVQHPFIVKLCFAFQTPEKLYLILEFLSGGELFYHLKQEGRFDESRARLYTAEIALALDHLHKCNIVYRDLKPENVVLDREGHVCITDFGLAKMSVQDAQTYTFCGTPEYLAPEILTGQGHGKAVDWWSLGVLLYEMLTGLPPFYSENTNEMYSLILRADLRFPDYVSAPARSLLTQLLNRDATRRLGANAADFDEKIRPHPFFAEIDWDALFARRIPPPFVPSAADVETAAHFDPEFTSEAAKDSIAVNPNREVDADFTGFSFANQSALGK